MSNNLKISKEVAIDGVKRYLATGMEPLRDENGDEYFLFSSMDRKRQGRFYLKDLPSE